MGRRTRIPERDRRRDQRRRSFHQATPIRSAAIIAEQIGWNGKFGNGLELKGKAKPKDPSAYKIVGKPAPRFDVKGKVYARTDYVTDVRRANPARCTHA